jgi:hypothetical protein
MTSDRIKAPVERRLDPLLVGGMIAAAQRPDGDIPCHGDGKTDPWDHVEAAMGLSVSGHRRQAERAYEWLAQRQLRDGSWYAAYSRGVPLDRTRDANLTAYIATGVYHHYLVSGDAAFLRHHWHPISKAIDFCCSLQAPSGAVYWAVSPQGRVDRMALLTGSSSIYMSLKCALATARILGYRRTAWQQACQKLAAAIAHCPHCFNMTKARFAMDWYYPVLAGVLRGAEAHRRIERHWRKFVVEEQGVRCVADRPWVTVAETCELTLALSAMGDHGLARLVFGWIDDKHDEDGAYWCGHTVPDGVIWPQERTTWTNAAVLLALDHLYHLTPAGSLFSHRHRWPGGNGP